MKLRYANNLPVKAPNSKVDIFVANELTKRTHGRVQVEIYHAETLGKSTEMIDLVGGGAVDIGNIPHGYSFARLPMNAFFNTPVIYKDLVIAAKMSKLGYQTQKKVQEDMQKNNLHPLFFRALNEYRLISKKPIRTLADFKGLKVRTFGAVNPKMFKALGAVPVSMTHTDAYEGLKRGTIDSVYLT
jgi:TRAP-type C4-dicarboxylate transport system substrate-binding protein